MHQDQLIRLCDEKVTLWCLNWKRVTMKQVGTLLSVFLRGELDKGGEHEGATCAHGCGKWVEGYATEFNTGNMEWTGEDVHCAQEHGFVTARRIRQLDDFVSLYVEKLGSAPPSAWTSHASAR